MEWEIQSGSVVCPFFHDGSSWKVNPSCSALFYRALCLLLKSEPWASCKGTIWYGPLRAQYRMFFRASSTSFWKHLSSFPGKESLPDVSILLCYFMCQTKLIKRLLLLKEGSFISSATFCCSLLPLALIRCFNKLMYSTNLSDNQKTHTFSELGNRNVCSWRFCECKERGSLRLKMTSPVSTSASW